MGLFDFLKSKKKIVSEAERRAGLLSRGRITDGTIIDTEVSEDGGEEVAHYFYTVQGADFESREILTKEQRENPLKYAPGASVGVRYDPKNHGNSILV